MEETLSVTCMKCAFCAAKNHCESCGRELDGALESRAGILSAVVRLPEGMVWVEHTLDRDALEEALEDVGLFPD